MVNSVQSSGSASPTGIKRDPAAAAATAAANLVTGGASGAISAATEVGKAVGALDWTKVKSETDSGNTARTNQALASVTAPTPPQQPNQMAMMAWQALSGIGPMLAGLLKKGNNGGNGNSNSKPPNSQNTNTNPNPTTPPKPNETSDIKDVKAPKDQSSTSKPIEEQKSTSQIVMFSSENIA